MGSSPTQIQQRMMMSSDNNSQTKNNNNNNPHEDTVAVIDYNPTTSTTPPITLHEAFRMSDIDCVCFIIDQIPVDDVRLQVLREQAIGRALPSRFILQYGDGTTPLTHYDNPHAQPVPFNKKRLTTATTTHYSYDAGDVLRIVKIQRQWRLRKEARVWKQIMLYMDTAAVREALFVE